MVERHAARVGEKFLETCRHLRRTQANEVAIHRGDKKLNEPTRDYRIKRQDAEYGEGSEQTQPTPMATGSRLRRQVSQRLYRRTPPGTANQDLRHHDRQAQQQHKGDIEQQKSSSPVFSGNIGKAPDVTQPYRGSGDRQDKGAPATQAPRSAFHAI